MVGFLADPFGRLLRPVGLLLGPVEPALRFLGRGPGLRGSLLRPRLLPGFGPALGEVGGLGGHVGGVMRHHGGFVGPFGPLPGFVGPFLRLIGPPSRPLGEFLCLLGVRPALAGVLGRPAALSLPALSLPAPLLTALSGAASFSTACLATLYGSPVSAIR